MSDDLQNATLLDLFRMETETQAQVLGDGLLALERAPTDASRLEACMRAAHSLKGAARIVGVEAGVSLAHVLEDAFVAAQRGALVLDVPIIDRLLQGVDLLMRLAHPPGRDPNWAQGAGRAEIDTFVSALTQTLASLAGDGAQAAASSEAPDAFDYASYGLSTRDADETPALSDDTTSPMSPTAPQPVSTPMLSTSTPSSRTQSSSPSPSLSPSPDTPGKRETFDAPGGADTAGNADASDNATRALRVSADNLDRLLRLSSEALVASRWSQPFAQSLQRLKRHQHEAGDALDRVSSALAQVADRSDEDRQAMLSALADLRRALGGGAQLLAQQIHELDDFDRRSTQLSQRLYDEALACRMRPIDDRLGGFARMVRDLGRSLGKPARLEIRGADTQVDRDILDQLEAPLGHLLRNAVDHGLESPEGRAAAGKPSEGVITLSARHSAGLLLVSVADDGAGIDIARVRDTVVKRGLVAPDTAQRLDDDELLEFLMLPGFTLRDTVTDVSGRGVGLDAVRAMVAMVRGTVRIEHSPGRGTKFILQLPLTLSVVRSLLVEVAGEPYALPLANLSRTLALPQEHIDMLEGRPHFTLDGRQIGLVSAQQVLCGTEPSGVAGDQPVVVFGEGEARYGLAVDKFLGERMLVVQPLDARLGKVPNIAAGALAEDGSPLLIIDTADLVRSIAKAVEMGSLERLPMRAAQTSGRSRKRVLVVDDSLTVRELERKLLAARGYDVSVAVDGMDGWNAVRSETFDMVITDVDMPRMDGIELVTLIKRDARTAELPVMIVSYKDREEDRQRGLDAGADYYLAKGSFHDDALLRAVVDLIGESGS
ncbi:MULTISPECIES: hybrid sensor histidine kinase/response regulator [Pandoraea]|uniref:hybrid sensor histidine kinase/response regulator n=1 Tax=Pandoraea TaxID=93217 RepID=UPI001F5CA03F|nr:MULTISPECIES: hybrid sensor histidine kinase/response regulator [Pandoraea]MCI3207228.1 hybrid sensor histidine kinase/response regulator [Pandoraea sp. LA3]MDN4585257.1 hybrid sensor histidine kinase/response regulator [Pandoraea capi]